MLSCRDLALGLSCGTIIGGLRGDELTLVGAAIVVVAILFYLLVEARWFAVQFGTGLLRGGVTALAGIVEGLIILLGAGLLLGL